jgi:RNA polymerase sigma-70 factor (ECF subfamily)
MNNETSLGAQTPGFPTTNWTALLAADNSLTETSRQLLGGLLANYWRPVYLTIRRGWGRSVEDAKDLTQEFLSRTLEGGISFKVDRQKGRFRDWMKAALKHFLLNERRDQAAKKRGGHLHILSLEGFERIDQLESSDSAPPEEPELVFDREWARELLRRCLERLKGEMTLQNKEAYFEAFRLHELESSPEGPSHSYREIAGKLGISPFDVGYYLKTVRSVLKGIVKEEIGKYAASPEEIEDEITRLSELLGE